MRAVMVRPGPHFSVADVHRGWLRALTALGVQVVEFDLDRRLDFYTNTLLERDGQLALAFDPESAVRLAANGLKQLLYDWWPDVVIVTSAFFVPPDFYATMRARGHKLVALFTESPYEDDKQLERAGLFDVVLLNDPTNLDAYRAVNEHTYYVPHAYDPTVHMPGPATHSLLSDVCFVGTGYPSRYDMLRNADWTGLQLLLAGNWQTWADDPWVLAHMAHDVEDCIANDDAVLLYQSTKCSINIYRKEASATAAGWAMGPREVELAACGTFFVREPRGESDDVLHMLPTFEPDGLTDVVRWWLDHDDARDAATMAARAAIADRTFDANAKRLLSVL